VGAGAEGPGGPVRVGVDTGGTFTDLVDASGRIDKVPSTPADPAHAVATAVATARARLAPDAAATDLAAATARAAPGGVDVLAHGTTVPTNALLERRGGRVALVCTEGHADVIEIARQVRPSLYDATVDRPEPLVARSLRLEVGGRLDSAGAELVPLGELRCLPPRGEVDAVAVCLLHADRNPAHERTIASRLRAAGWDVTCSHEISPEFREYERTVTTVVNAFLRPVCRPYLAELAALAQDVLVMTSAGGLRGLAEARETPAALLLSGPAGGVLAASAAAVSAGWPDAVSFDMGGTSTDVCLIRGGRPDPAAQRTVAGYPVRLPSLDVHTIGAGGGSIARIDPGGALVVGPHSAGARPGPACYGLGGEAPTVTDADLVAGRLPHDHALPGLDRLDAGAARAALARAGVDAAGVQRVVDSSMVQAIRRVSVERGVDPRGLALVAFGGAGPLHACALADELGMPVVVVPARAGVLSAAGILTAPRQADLVRGWPDPDDHAGAMAAAAALAGSARQQVIAALPVPATAGVEEVSVDCRYRGQSHELTVASPTVFAAEHERRNGYSRPGVPVEVIAIRARAAIPAPVSMGDLADVDRRGTTRGPAVIAEVDCTIWVADGWTARVGGGGAWILNRG